MGNPLGTAFVKHLEHDVQIVEGFIALDSSSNVIGVCPTATGPGSGPYTLCKGIAKALGVAGAVLTQPHQGVNSGTYIFTFDEPWVALLGAYASLIDITASSIDSGSPYVPLQASFRANVRSSTAASTSVRAPGVDPGTDSNLTVQTLNVYWRSLDGSLVDPAPTTGWWMRLLLKRTAIY